MRKNSRLIPGLVLALLLTVLISTAYIAPAFAVEPIEPWTEHANVVGETVINIPGGADQVKIIFAHYDCGDHGVRDDLQIYYVKILPTGVVAPMIIGWYSDTCLGVDFIEVMMEGMPCKVEKLKPWQLQMLRICKIAIAWWTVPLEIPELTWTGGGKTPPVTIPPGALVLKGCGEEITGVELPRKLPTNIKKSAVFTGYNAKAFLTCPEWRYCGPVGGHPTLVDIVKTDTTYTVDFSEYTGTLVP
jgi:hypothetical protein